MTIQILHQVNSGQQEENVPMPYFLALCSSTCFVYMSILNQALPYGLVGVLRILATARISDQCHQQTLVRLHSATGSIRFYGEVRAGGFIGCAHSQLEGQINSIWQTLVEEGFKICEFGLLFYVPFLGRLIIGRQFWGLWDYVWCYCNAFSGKLN